VVQCNPPGKQQCLSANPSYLALLSFVTINRRVHSMSGAAEWWPTDLAACICSCPNDSDMCSHLFGVAVLHPKYRPKLALLMKVCTQDTILPGHSHGQVALRSAF
jgi:hypothetical protein